MTLGALCYPQDIPILVADCDAIISNADTAIKACQEQVKGRDVLIKSQDESIRLLLKQRNEAIEQGSVTNVMPWYLWLLTGAAAAVIVNNIRR